MDRSLQRRYDLDALRGHRVDVAVANLERRFVEPPARLVEQRSPLRVGEEVPESDVLEEAARGDENLLPRILDCVENYVTVGEISHRLRKVWGEYREAVTV
mgnify:CR=1 FL=1